MTPGMNNYIDPDGIRLVRHPYADHPAALVLADHKAILRDPPATPTRCDCGWRGPSCDHPAHLAEMLDRAGVLLPADMTVVDWP